MLLVHWKMWLSMWVQYVQSYLDHSVPLFCSFQKLVSLWPHCSVPLSLRHWCHYCPAVLFFSETGVFMAPLFCSFQKPVSLSSYCSVPFRNWCPYGVGVKKRWEFWHFCASANWSGCSQNPPWNPHSRLVLCPLCVDGWVHMVLRVCGVCVYMHIRVHMHFFCISMNNNICRFVSLRLPLLANSVPVSVQQECLAYMTIDKFAVLMSLPLINFVHVCPASMHGVYDHM